MIFKQFAFKVVLRVLALTALITACVVASVHYQKVFTATLLGVLALISVVELIYYVKRTNRALAKFFTANLYGDSTIHFSENKLGSQFPALFNSMNELTLKWKKSKIEKEYQYRFFNLMVQQINVGIIALDSDDNILQMNRMAEELLGIPTQKSWKRMEKLVPAFTQSIQFSTQFPTQLVKCTVGTDPVSFKVTLAKIEVEASFYWLLSIQDIKQELQSEEIEAWHKLIRVLTHEIVNSITPIYSLSETTRLLLEQCSEDEMNQEEIKEQLFKSVRTIESRSQGLLRFVQDYRKITQVPQARLEEITLSDLIARIVILMRPELESHGISLRAEIQNSKLNLLIDAQLIEQVLINLIINAKDAVDSLENPDIKIVTSSNLKQFFIEIVDNGKGVELEDLDQIYTPFYTTKQNGNGIGLSLSKNIMRMHNGSIRYMRKGENTHFILTFPL